MPAPISDEEALSRVLGRIEKSSPSANVSGECWIFKGCLTGGGYGMTRRRGKGVYTHRFVYQMTKGEIPPELSLDHLCRNRSCCNPEHLEPVTNQENIRRGAASVVRAWPKHCSRGHDVCHENNLYSKDKPRRVGCKACLREKTRERRLNERL